MNFIKFITNFVMYWSGINILFVFSILSETSPTNETTLFSISLVSLIYNILIIYLTLQLSKFINQRAASNPVK